jgi:cytochrome c-type biogenesis protein CcmF
MPLINVLWLGTGVLMVGFTVAMVRRFKDFRKEV